MTLNGTVNKCMILLFVCIFIANLTWSSDEITPSASVYIIFGAIDGLVLSFITVFKKNWSPITAPLKAVTQGGLLVVISSIYEIKHPGIVMNAVF